MKRVLVISDIHGELNKFNELLGKTDYDCKKDQLILLGDYVDRGPDSRGVLEKVMKLKEDGAIVLRGNHEDMLLNALHKDPEVLRKWKINGGLCTLQSYDSEIQDMKIPATDTFKEHVAFIQNLDYVYQFDHYIFVHGGLQPDTPVEETDPHTLVWIRDEFHNGYRGEKTVVFGHTQTSLLHGEDCDDVFFGDNNIIGIDGGAVYGGQLNCLDLNNRKTYNVR